MRKTLLPLTPLPSVNSTGAGGGGGLALGVAVKRGLAVAEECGDAVAVGEVELRLCRPFASQPPSYSTAARRTHGAAPSPTASRIAVSGLRDGVAGAISWSKRSAGSCSKTTLLPVAGGIGSPGASAADVGGGRHASSSGSAGGSAVTGSGSGSRTAGLGSRGGSAGAPRQSPGARPNPPPRATACTHLTR